MKKIIAAAALSLFCLGTAQAADDITLPAKNGNVTFTHKKHQESLKDCKVCHGEGTPGKLTLDKDSAHKLCKGCHETKKAGPTRCGECHKK
ncbi:MAG: hypothetical protein FD174_580 [Geobacteraceae bacterium]|nr:MAG: hypothetical protein FD174_580 [Geobacteraceae bacterium]